ncbi:MAG: serine hydrolase domain-containing protein [Acidobacteriaceae bacterium]
MPQFPTAQAVLTKAIEERVFPGAAYGVLLRDKLQAMESVGRFTYATDSPSVLPATIFDIASVSKVLATMAMAMLLWERSQLDLDRPIADHLPEFVSAALPDSARHTITARMLLAHSSGLPAYAPLYEHCHSPATLLQACLQMPLEAPPETQTVYSDIGFIVLGHLLETIAQEPLGSYCVREIFHRLDMGSTLYLPPPELRVGIPPTAATSPIRPRLIQGEVHDDNCYVLGGVSGHAGIFSNVADILRFAECILRGGAPIFQPQTVSLFTAPHLLPLRPLGQHRALGWDMPSRPSSSGQFFSDGSVGHLGYTGTSLWIDFEKQLAIALLTNRTFPGNGPDGISNQIQQTRPRFHDAVIWQLDLEAI